MSNKIKKIGIFTNFIILLAVCIASPLISLSYALDEQPKSVIATNLDLGNWDKPLVLDYKKIKKCSQLDDLLSDYIKKYYEGYKLVSRIFTMDEDRFILIFSLENDNEVQKLVYFDVSDAYKKLKKYPNERKQVEYLKSKHIPKV